MRKLYKSKRINKYMKQEIITLSKEEYEKLKKKAEIADDAVVQLGLSLEALRAGKVKKYDLKIS